MNYHQYQRWVDRVLLEGGSFHGEPRIVADGLSFFVIEVFTVQVMHALTAAKDLARAPQETTGGRLRLHYIHELAVLVYLLPPLPGSTLRGDVAAAAASTTPTFLSVARARADGSRVRLFGHGCYEVALGRGDEMTAARQDAAVHAQHFSVEVDDVVGGGVPAVVRFVLLQAQNHEPEDEEVDGRRQSSQPDQEKDKGAHNVAGTELKKSISLAC